MKQSSTKQSETQKRLAWLNKYYLQTYGGWKVPAILAAFWLAFGFYGPGLGFALFLLGLVAAVFGLILLMPNGWVRRYTAWVGKGTKMSSTQLVITTLIVVIGSMIVLVGGMYLWQRMHPNHHEVCIQTTTYPTCNQW